LTGAGSSNGATQATPREPHTQSHVRTCLLFLVRTFSGAIVQTRMFSGGVSAAPLAAGSLSGLSPASLSEPKLLPVQSSLLVPSERRAMDYFNVTELVQHARPLAEQLVTTLVNEPAHLIVEVVLLIFVLVLLCKRSYLIPKDSSTTPLSASVRFCPPL